MIYEVTFSVARLVGLLNESGLVRAYLRTGGLLKVVADGRDVWLEHAPSPTGPWSRVTGDDRRPAVETQTGAYL